MAKQQDEKKKFSLDPGNTLLVLYIGFVLFFMLLAIVVNGNASVVPPEVNQWELWFNNASKTADTLIRVL